MADINYPKNFESTIPTDSALLEKVDEWSDWKGTYMNEAGSSITLEGPAADGAVNFELVNNDVACGEIVKGTANLSKPSVAVYYEQMPKLSAKLSFTYNPGQIQIMEFPGYTHASACKSFEGFYKKIK